jgi:hypothetical protein
MNQTLKRLCELFKKLPSTLKLSLIPDYELETVRMSPVSTLKLKPICPSKIPNMNIRQTLRRPHNRVKTVKIQTAKKPLQLTHTRNQASLEESITEQLLRPTL